MASYIINPLLCMGRSSISLAAVTEKVQEKVAQPAAEMVKKTITVIAPKAVEAIASSAEKSLSKGGSSWGKVLFVAGSALAAAGTAWYFSRSKKAESIPQPTIEKGPAEAVATAKKALNQGILTPRPIAEVKSLETLQLEKFTKAAKCFVSSDLSSDAFSVRSYGRFIQTQKNILSSVPEDLMHQIVSDLFMAKHGVNLDKFLLELNDDSRLHEEVEMQMAIADEKDTVLRLQDKELAGSDRFSGKIDRAWVEYFDAKKNYIRALAPLCRFLAGQQPVLSQHEKDTLDFNLSDPRSSNGSSELRLMEQGLKHIATYAMGSIDQYIDTSSLIAAAESYQGSEYLVASLRSSVEELEAKFQTYQEYDDKRERIAGRGINPEVDPVAEGSELAHVRDMVESAELTLKSILEQRAAQAAFLEAMQSKETLQRAFRDLPEDSRRI